MNASRGRRRAALLLSLASLTAGQVAQRSVIPSAIPVPAWVAAVVPSTTNIVLPSTRVASAALWNGTGAIVIGGATAQGGGTMAPAGYFDAGNLGVLADLPTTSTASLPLYGTTVVTIPSFATAGLNFSSYAFFGATAPAGRETNAVYGWVSSTSSWVLVSTVRDSITVGAPNGGFPPARKLASAAFLSNCEGRGVGCIIVVGGMTDALGTFLWGGWINAWVLYIAESPPRWRYIPAVSGVTPGGRIAPGLVPSPDGTAVYMYGGDGAGNTGFGLTLGGVASGVYVLTTVGFYGPNVFASATSPLTLMKLVSFRQPTIMPIGAWCRSASGCTPCPSKVIAPFGTVTGICPLNLRPSIIPCCSSSDQAVDGDLNTLFDANFNSGAHSITSTNPWWGVDLGTATSVARITIYFRTDCCLDRIAPYQIWVGNSAATGPAWLPGQGPTNVMVPNPYTDAPYSPMVFDLDIPINARYVYIIAPGTGRFLMLMEVQVWSPVPYMWQTLGGAGLLNSNTTVVTTQSSLISRQTVRLRGISTVVPVATFGSSDLACDGNVATAAATSDLISPSSPAGLLATTFWQLDLGSVFAISSIKYWDGSGLTSTVGSSSRAKGVEIYAGQSSVYNQNPRCLTPSDTLGWNAYNIPCFTNARYITVRKVAGANANENMIQLAELQVYGNLLNNQPAGRAAHAMAAFGSYFVVFGGYNSALVLLNDLRFFDMMTNKWLPVIPPLGTPPAPRTYSLLTPLPLNPLSLNVSRFLLYGGVSATGALGDTFTLQLPLCPPLSTSPGGLAANTMFLNCTAAGGLCRYSCVSPFVSTNAVGFVACGYDGQWTGSLPLCTATGALLPSAPTITGAIPSVVAPGQATVTWSAPTSSGASALVSYTIATTPVDYVEHFYGNFENRSAWTFIIGTGSANTVSAYSFTSIGEHQLIIDAAPTSACTSTLTRCLVLHRPFPTVVGLAPGGSWALESYFSFDPLSIKFPQAGIFAGIGVFDVAKGGAAGSLEFYAGLSFTTRVNVGYASVFNSASSWLPTPSTTTSATINTPYAYVRVERDGTNLRWRVGYRFKPTTAWVFMPWVSDTALLRGATPNTGNGFTNVPSNLRIAISAQSQNGGIRSYAYVGFMRWAPLNCTDPGFIRTIAAPATSAVVTGLDPNVGYTFTVTAANTYASGSPSSPSVPVVIPPPLSTNVYNASALVEVARGRGIVTSVYSSTNTASLFTSRQQCNANPNQNTVSGSLSASAITYNPRVINDGSLGCFGAYVAGCCAFSSTSGNSSAGDWIAIDLGIPTAVKEIAIWNNHDPILSAALSGFSVYVGNTAATYQPVNYAATSIVWLDQTTWSLNNLCTGVPASITAANTLPITRSVPATGIAASTLPASPYASRFQCSYPTGLVGRYVILVAPYGKQLAIEEVQVYASNNCTVSRAALTPNATTAPGTVCDGNVPLGTTCAQTCNSGFVQSAGSLTATCNGDTWNALPLVCEAPCPTLSGPAISGISCSQSLYANDFSSASSPSSTSLVNLIETTPVLGPHVTILDGMLQVNAYTECNDENVVVATSSALFNWRSNFVWRANVYLTTDRAGIVWRALDAYNMFRFVLDPFSGMHELQRLNGGIVTILATITQALKPNNWYSLTANFTQSLGNLHQISINGRVVVSVGDGSFGYGYAGVYAASTALFDDVSYAVDCSELGACASSTSGGFCSFTCPFGFAPSGTSARTCSAGAWFPSVASAPFACTFTPPVFPPSAISVPENSVSSTPVGAPLQATITSPDYSISYLVTGVYAWGNTSLAAPFPFWVDSCSGQVKVLTTACTAGVPFCAFPLGLDFEACNMYLIQVAASVPNAPLGLDGFPPTTTVNITLTLTNVDEPPQCSSAQTFSLVENSAPGAVAGVLSAVDIDSPTSTIRYRLVGDSSGGLFTMPTNSSPITNVSKAVLSASNLGTTGLLNYEKYDPVTLLPTFLLSYQVYSQPPCAYDPTGVLYGTCVVTLTLTNANDPPYFLSDTVISINEELVNTPVVLPVTIPGTLALDDDYLPATVIPYTNSAFATGGATYTVLPFTSPLCKAPVAPLTYPTLDGTLTGSPVLSVSSAGVVSIIARPYDGTGWANASYFLYAGQILRNAWPLCLSVTDGFGANTTGTVLVTMPAYLPYAPLVDSVSNTTEMPTVGGGIITFQGSNFGNASVVWAGYATLSGGLQPTGGLARLPCVLTVPQTTIVCTTVAGVGSGMTLSLYVDATGSGKPALAVPVPPLAAVIASYAAPVVTGVTGNTNISSDALPGAFTLTLFGNGFGPQTGYTPTLSLGGADTGIFSCSFSVVPAPSPALADGMLQCYLPPGAGALLPWTLTILGMSTTSSGASQAISYNTPVVTDVWTDIGVDINNLDTVAPQNLYITGTDFGPTGASLSARIGTWPLVSCVRSPIFPTKSITCVISGGIGINLPVVVIAGGQASSETTPFVVSFQPIVLTAITGPGALGAASEGFQSVFLAGTGFGPAGSAPPAIVTYGHWPSPPNPPFTAFHYTANQCMVTTPGTQITCLTAPGVGAGHAWVIARGGQYSNVYWANTSYAPPQVLSFSGPGTMSASTTGGQVVNITGRNFGPADAYTRERVVVTYGADLATPVDCDPMNVPTFSCPSTLLSSVVFAASCDLVSVPALDVNGVQLYNSLNEALTASMLSCFTARGAGTGLAWQVVVDDQMSQQPSTSYAPPEVWAITDQLGAPVTDASVFGGTAVLVQGNFFGPLSYNATGASLVQNVTYGPSGKEYSLPSSAWTLLSQNTLNVTLLPGSGGGNFFLVRVADQVSAPNTSATFAYATPTVTNIFPRSGPTSSSIAVPVVITVSVLNLPLIAMPFGLRVGLTFGNAIPSSPMPPGVIDIRPNVPLGASAIAAATNADGSVNISFALPTSFAGAGRAVKVYIAPQAAQTGFGGTTLDPQTLFTFTPPSISQAFLTSLPNIESPTLGFSQSLFTYQQACLATPVAQLPPGWDCLDTSIVQLTLLGSNFGALNNVQDGTIKTLSALVSNVSGVPVWDDGASFFVGPAFCSAFAQTGPCWSDSQIIAFTKLNAGVVQVAIASSATSVLTPIVPVTQAATFAFSALAPNVTALTPTAASTTAMPTCTYPSSSVCPSSIYMQPIALTLSVENLAWALSASYSTSSGIVSPYTIVALYGNSKTPAVLPLYQADLVTPLSLPMSASDLAAATNSDGTVSVHIVLPAEGAGVGVGLYLAVFSQDATSPLVVGSPSAPSSQITYEPPIINNIASAQAYFWTPDMVNVSQGVTCPFPAGSSVWNCSNPLMIALTISGSSFGPAPGSASDNNVIRLLELGYNATGANGTSRIVYSPSTIFVGNWSQETIVAYATVNSGWVRVSLVSNDTSGNTNTQSAQSPISTDSPGINALRYLSSFDLNPLPIVPAPFPNTGLDASGDPALISLDVANLVKGDAIFVIINSPYMGRYASVRFPPGLTCPSSKVSTACSSLIVPSGGFVSPYTSCYTGLMQWCYTPDATQGVQITGVLSNLIFQLPPGQGTNVPIQLRRQLAPPQSTNIYAITSFRLSYAPPILTGAVVIANGIQRNLVFSATGRVLMPTDTVGTSTRLRLYGTNLGVAPILQLGAGWQCFQFYNGTFPISSAMYTCRTTMSPSGYFPSMFGLPANLTSCGPQYSCWEFTPPPGEGINVGTTSTTQLGYNIYINAGGVTSERMRFGYDAPVVTAVYTSTPGAAIPTAGGTNVTLVGYNFGFTVPSQPPALITIAGFNPTLPPYVFKSPLVAIAGFNPFPLCSSVQRLSNTALSCILLAGGGTNLTLVAVVGAAPGSGFVDQRLAGVSPNVLSYDSPYLTTPPTIFSGSSGGALLAVSPSTSVFPILTDGTPGGSTVTIFGANFGLRPLWSNRSLPPPPYCVFLSWANRPLSSTDPVCDGKETWFGEGEIAYDAVTAWSQTSITFLVPQGGGRKQVQVSVIGATLSLPAAPPVRNLYLPPGSPSCLFLQYASPTITHVASVQLVNAVGSASLPKMPTLWPRLKTPITGAVTCEDAAGGYCPNRGNGQRANCAVAANGTFWCQAHPVVETDGSTIVTLAGTNFGPAWSATASTPSLPCDITLAPSLPTSYPAIVWSSSCATPPPIPYAALYGGGYVYPNGQTLFTSNGILVGEDGFALHSIFTPSVSGITTDAATCFPSIISRTHTSITFAAPPGIGIDGAIQLLGLEPMGAPTATPQTQSVLMVSSNSNFLTDYAPPTFYADFNSAYPAATSLAPFNVTTVYLPVRNMFVGLFGLNFGTVNDVISLPVNSTIDRQALLATILLASTHGVPCKSVERLLSGGIMCQVSTSAPAGFATVSVTVASNVGSYPGPPWPTIDPRTGLVYSTPLLFVCDAGFYGRINETCIPCPKQSSDPILSGAKCLGFTPDALPMSQWLNASYASRFESFFSYPVPNPGWYNLNMSDKLTTGMYAACPPGQADGDALHAPSCIVPCQPLTSCLGNNYCAPGYISKAPMYRCASCAPGFFSSAGSCIPCPDSPYALIIGILLLVIAIAFAGYVLNKRQVNIAVLSIGVDFFQVLAIFSTANVSWPPSIKQLFRILSAFNLNIEIVAPECLVPDVSYRTKFLVIMGMPVLLLTLFGVIFTVQVAIKWCRGHRDRAKLYSHASALVSSALVLVYLLYLYITRTVMDVFNCVPTSPPDGNTYLQVVFERCGVPGGTQLTLMPIAVLALIFYSFGYPVYIGYIIWRNRELAMEDQLLRAKGVGNDRLTNPNAYAFRRMFGRSYFQFKPDWNLWILAIIARKFCIAITAVMFNMNASFQMAACLLIMFLAFSAQVQIRPYMSPADTEEVLASHVVSSATSAMHARLFSRLAHVASLNKKKTRKNLLSAEGKIDGRAVLGVLGNWLFNYNTIEAMMQFSAVIVCLCALMYASFTDALSSDPSYYASAQSGVTGVLIVVISIAILYFVSVVLTEITILYTEAARRKGLELAEKRKRLSRNNGDASSPTVLNDRLRRSKRVTEEDLTAGGLDSQMNPLLMSATGTLRLSKGTGGKSGVEPSEELMSMATGLLSHKVDCPIELWRVFQGTYAELASVSEALQKSIADAKHKQQAAVLSMGMVKRKSAEEDEEGAVMKPSPTFARPGVFSAPPAIFSMASEAEESPKVKSIGSSPVAAAVVREAAPAVEEDPSPAAEPEESPWEQRTSRSTGRVYWYNRTTGVSSNAAPEGVGTAPPATPAASATSDAPLPEPWVQRTSRSTNRVYYYNSVSGVSSNERPV